MQRQHLQKLSRDELIREAERAGVPRPRVLTQAELIDEILKRTASSDRERSKARGWLGKARDLLANVVEKGLHLPDAAAAIRQGPKGWPPPPPPLPTVTLAEIYAAQGHLERAVSVLDDVLRREPDHDEARELRERFLAQLSRGTKPGSGSKSSPAPAQEDGGAEAESPENQASEAIPSTVASDAPAVPSTVPTGAAVPERGAAPTEEPPRFEAGDPDEGGPAALTSRSPSARPAAISGAQNESVRTVAEDIADVRDVPPADEQSVHNLNETSRGAETVGADLESVHTGSTDAAPIAGEEAASADEVAAENAAGATDGEAEKEASPAVYDVDEVVAIAVDPSTFYVYWEVRPTTFAHIVAGGVPGFLALRVTAVTPGWDGPIVESRDVRVDALHGDRFIHHVRPRADVRVSIGFLTADRFEPIAVGAEVSAPKAFVAAGSPATTGSPLDLSEGPHGAKYTSAPNTAALASHFRDEAGHVAVPKPPAFVPRDLHGVMMEPAPGAQTTGWIWVAAPDAGEWTEPTGGAPAPLSDGYTWRMDEDGTWWAGEGGQSWWEVTSEGGTWGGASEGGRWGGASERRVQWGGASERRVQWGGASEGVHMPR
ncbi:MAG: DUF4912 domain-containing protein [Polyangiaceae bacterium]|nr:DUF4912 domain-containing protein [Polyangiaceae bacterium]